MDYEKMFPPSKIYIYHQGKRGTKNYNLVTE